MKKIFTIAFLIVAFAFSAVAQEQGKEKIKPTDAAKPELNSKGEPVVRIKDNAPVDLKVGDSITRGDALAAGVGKLSVEKALKDPMKYADKTVQVEGIIVRSCKKEGCWAEMADKAGGKSVRVTFGDHKFFIPLNSAGLMVKAQGKFVTKVLPKEHVDHLINDDGAKFANRNADGTVTEVSFDASGIELKQGK